MWSLLLMPPTPAGQALGEVYHRAATSANCLRTSASEYPQSSEFDKSFFSPAVEGATDRNYSRAGWRLFDSPRNSREGAWVGIDDKPLRFSNGRIVCHSIYRLQ